MSMVHPAQLLFSEKHPLTKALNMRFHPGDDKELQVSLKAPESFADQDGIHVHTGLNTLLLDTVMGCCAIGELKKPQPIATIKLTTNHLGRLKIGEEVICSAIYEGEESEITYVSGKVMGSGGTHLVSQAIGTFMIGTTTKSIRDKS